MFTILNFVHITSSYHDVPVLDVQSGICRFDRMSFLLPQLCLCKYPNKQSQVCTFFLSQII